MNQDYQSTAVADHLPMSWVSLGETWHEAGEYGEDLANAVLAETSRSLVEDNALGLPMILLLFLDEQPYLHQLPKPKGWISHVGGGLSLRLKTLPAKRNNLTLECKHTLSTTELKPLLSGESTHLDRFYFFWRLPHVVFFSRSPTLLFYGLLHIWISVDFVEDVVQKVWIAEIS
jgi:hypothetical protein